MEILVIVALFLVIVLLVAYLVWRSSAPSPLSEMIQRLGERFGPGPQGTPVTVIQGDEEITVPHHDRQRAETSTTRLVETLRKRAADSSRTLIILLALLIGILALVLLPRLVPASSDQFVVLVAPFRDQGGEVSQAGRTVANQLIELLPAQTNNRVLTRRLGAPPSDPTEALALLERNGADVLLWGEITPGGLLDQESLVPMLVYEPNGLFAPFAWDGYADRFVMPTAYVLAAPDQPINGLVVLPPLFDALAAYSAGNYNNAFVTLDALVSDYPSLSAVLPHALRGNMLWARGEYTAAVDAYRRTGVLEASAGQSSQLAYLANNLGVIHQDAGNLSEMRAAFEQSAQLLDGRDLRQLRVNWGIEELRAGRPVAARDMLEAGRNLVPDTENPSSTLLLNLAETYRGTGEYELAERALNAVERQINTEVNQVPAELRSLRQAQLQAAVLEQRALVRVARQLNGGVPLLWSLHVSRAARPNATTLLDDLTRARNELEEAVRQTDGILTGWNRRSAAEEAADQPIGGLISQGQVRRAEAALRERRRWESAVELELAQAQGIVLPQGLGALWVSLTGDRTPLGQARTQLTTLVQTQPSDIDSAVLLGRALNLSNQADAARETFNTAAAIDQTRPEPVYGQALTVLPNDPPEARRLLNQAIALEPRYFPARMELAQLAENEQDWATAVEQRRWLAQEYGGTEQQLALARTLRRSGPGGYSEAEQTLLPLANANNVDALVDLSHLYQAVGDNDAALTALTRARQIAPRNPDVAYELGNVYAASGNIAQAEAQYRLAADNRPGFTDAHLALGQLYAFQGRVSDAAREYRLALDAGASDPAALKQIGNVFLQSREQDAAIDAFLRAREVAENDSEVHHGLAQAYLLDNQIDRAEASERRALELRNGNYPEARVGLGDIALRRNDPTTAIEEYTAALRENDQLTAAHVGLGRAAAAQENWAVALGHFQSAVNRDPESAEAHLWLGEALVRQDRPSEALVAYNQALTLQPNYAEAYFGIAQAQASTGALDDAEANLERALELRLRYAEAFLLRGRLYEQRNQVDAAIQWYSDAISANGQLAEPYYRRARLYIRTDRIDQAQRDLEDAVRIQDNFAEARYWLGRTYLVNGRTEAARDQFQRAVDLRGGNYPEARFYQGLAEEQLGRRTEAVESFRNTLQQGQGTPWAGEAQAALIRLGE